MATVLVVDDELDVLMLVRAGLEAVVIDKARFPREKVCGDALTHTLHAGVRQLVLEILGLRIHDRADGGSGRATDGGTDDEAQHESIDGGPGMDEQRPISDHLNSGLKNQRRC